MKWLRKHTGEHPQGAVPAPNHGEVLLDRTDLAESLAHGQVDTPQLGIVALADGVFEQSNGGRELKLLLKLEEKDDEGDVDEGSCGVRVVHSD